MKVQCIRSCCLGPELVKCIRHCYIGLEPGGQV